jgi:hypothetical protein
MPAMRAYYYRTLRSESAVNSVVRALKQRH